MPKLCLAPIPIVRIAAPQITGTQKLRSCGLSAASTEVIAILGRRPSEGLDPGPQFDFERPGAAWLAQDLDIGLGDRGGVERRVGPVRRVGPAGAAHAAVDDEVRDMDALRPQFSRRALR